MPSLFLNPFRSNIDNLKAAAYIKQRNDIRTERQEAVGNGAIWENQEDWLQEERLKIEDLKREKAVKEQERKKSWEKQEEVVDSGVTYRKFKK